MLRVHHSVYKLSYLLLSVINVCYLGGDLFQLYMGRNALKVSCFPLVEWNAHVLDLLLPHLVLTLVHLQKYEEVSFMSVESEFSLCFCQVKGFADLLLLEYSLVKALCEVNCCIIEYFSVLLDTDHVPCTAFLEDLANEFGVACCDKDQLKIWHCLLDQSLESVLADQLTFTVHLLEK